MIKWEGKSYFLPLFCLSTLLNQILTDEYDSFFNQRERNSNLTSTHFFKITGMSNDTILPQIIIITTCPNSLYMTHCGILHILLTHHT